MGVIVDTNVIVAFLIEKEKNHNKALTLFRSLLENSHGSLFVTDYIIDEVITLIGSRFKRKDLVEQAYSFMSEDSGIFNFIKTESHHLTKAWEYWKKYTEYPKRPLSFTDASILVVSEEYSIEYVASFDTEFDGLISVLK